MRKIKKYEQILYVINKTNKFFFLYIEKYKYNSNLEKEFIIEPINNINYVVRKRETIICGKECVFDTCRLIYVLLLNFFKMVVFSKIRWMDELILLENNLIYTMDTHKV